jgi:hypothetical protein
MFMIYSLVILSLFSRNVIPFLCSFVSAELGPLHCVHSTVHAQLFTLRSKASEPTLICKCSVVIMIISNLSHSLSVSTAHLITWKSVLYHRFNKTQFNSIQNSISNPNVLPCSQTSSYNTFTLFHHIQISTLFSLAVASDGDSTYSS